MSCINCGTEISGKFCTNCGQRTTVKRITFKDTWLDFWAQVYGFDGLFLRTIRDLTIRPGVVAKTVISGNRVSYYGPVGYFFLMITLYLVFLSMMGLDLLDFMKGTQSSLQLEGSDTKLSQQVQGFIAENIKLFSFLFIPFQALTAKYLFFRKSGYNFLENAVLPFYTAGHLNWISILTAIGFKLIGAPIFYPAGGGSLFVTIDPIITILYFGFSYSAFMTYQSKIKAFLKGIGVFILSYFLFVFSFSIVVGIVIVSLKYLSPETFEMIRPSNNH